MIRGSSGKRKGDGAIFPQLEAVSLAESVVTALKDAFFSGTLKPGAVIVERQIAEEMNVGTPVVREAQWARPIVTKSDVDKLKSLVDRLVEAGQRENRREFLERDIEFHRYCWKLSGNPFLAETLERLMAPLFAFVVLASGHPMTAAMGREHYALVEALRSMEEPEFSAVVRKAFTGFAFRWISSAAARTAEGVPEKPIP